MMKFIKVDRKDMMTSPITNHEDFIPYNFAEQSLKNKSREILDVYGFLHGKAVVVEVENFFTHDDIIEQAEMLKKEREEREKKELSVRKGFTIKCRNCGSKKVKIETDDRPYIANGFEGEQTVVVITCECGNKEELCE